MYVVYDILSVSADLSHMRYDSICPMVYAQALKWCTVMTQQ